MRRDIVWELRAELSLEHLRLEIGRQEIVAESTVVAELDGAALRLDYVVRCDAGWRTRSASLVLVQGDQQRRMEIARAASGWTVDGAARPDLDGCVDIDIMVTPFTNSLAIHQLGLEPDEARPFKVVYVALPPLALSAQAQEYTRLDPATPPRRFRFRNLTSTFVAEVEVDEDALVVSYGDLWQRR